MEAIRRKSLEFEEMVADAGTLCVARLRGNVWASSIAVRTLHYTLHYNLHYASPLPYTCTRPYSYTCSYSYSSIYVTAGAEARRERNTHDDYLERKMNDDW